MQKLINDPHSFVDEMLEGLALAHHSRIRQIAGERRALTRSNVDFAGRVTIATGGGSGHLPLFVGYLGDGLVDGCAVGDVFASPTAEQMFAVTRAIDGGCGVLYLYGNYGGDVLNFDFGADLSRDVGIQVETVLAADDVASASPDRAGQRRGIAGIFFGYKAAGACAASGGDLATVKAVAEAALARTRTMGVALSPCILPAVGRPTFELAHGEMEIGMGIHGEPGVGRAPIASADAIADELLARILEHFRPAPGAECGILVNGLGATPAEELYVVYRRIHRNLEQAGYRPSFAHVGEYATSLEMAGASISVIEITSDLKPYLLRGADSPLTMTGGM